MGTVVGSWRLKLIVFLMIVLTSIYILNSFFYVPDINNEGYYQPDEITLAENMTTENIENDQNFINVLFDIGNYLTFGNITNEYARIFINLLVAICWLSVGYLIYTFVKEWIPFV